MKKETRIEIREIPYNVYVAEDGTEFDYEQECKEYELKLKGVKFKNLSDFQSINNLNFLDCYKWYYVADKDDLELFKQALKKQYYNCDIYMEYDDEYYCNTWVSFTKTEDDYGTDVEIISYKIIEEQFTNVKNVLSQNNIDKK
ncbi:hypothetical protein PMX22_20110 [Clostridium butyricum]|uniref:hypothetical protein n=1 Tax=Clostridium butyricum TaxID=1492 RepID=UPI00233106A0|nr:hypothetical protein [Clostridium butyricum]MDB2162091.1 hypothetical protein [Clostridium butyricum]